MKKHHKYPPRPHKQPDSDEYKTTKFIFWCGIFCLALDVLIPELRVAFTALAILIPIVNLIFYMRYPSLRWHIKGGNKVSPLADSFIYAGGGFIVWYLAANQRFSYGLLGAAIVIFVLISVPFLIQNRARKEIVGSIISFVIVAALFSYGAAYRINQDYDFYPAKSYPMHVTEKEKTTYAKIIYCYLSLSDDPEGGHQSQKITVSWGDFLSVSVGDTVMLTEHPGVFHAPWFYLTPKE
jgi:uncharacterized membrane protein